MTPDTNILVRVVVMDDPQQAAQARAELEAADEVVLTLPALCEFCWVLKSYYRFAPAQIAGAVEALADGDNVSVDQASLSTGLAMLRAGGDFADGVIAEQGVSYGSREFLSFDRKAVRLLAELGFAARQPS